MAPGYDNPFISEESLCIKNVLYKQDYILSNASSSILYNPSSSCDQVLICTLPEFSKRVCLNVFKAILKYVSSCPCRLYKHFLNHDEILRMNIQLHFGLVDPFSLN